MPIRTKPKTERLGISRVEFFFSRLGWLFREQALHDYGIDAQVEIVIQGRPTGGMIALQVKSGRSYFSEVTDTDFIYRTDERHVIYWVKHCLPVILVLYDDENDLLYWENVSEDTCTSTGKGWKIGVPKTKLLTEESLNELSRLTQPPPYIQKLNRLRLDKRWIELVATGEVVYIEFEDWINKSLPRFNIRIGCDTRDDIPEQSWPTIYGVGLRIEEAMEHVLPWANFTVDEDEYEFHKIADWDAECYMGRDKEEGIEFFSEEFERWYSAPEGLVPIFCDGEASHYRLLLSLNELGKAFLFLNGFLEKDDDVKDRVFSLEF